MGTMPPALADLGCRVSAGRRRDRSQDRSGIKPRLHQAQQLHRGDPVLTRWEPAPLSLACSRRVGASSAYLPVFTVGYILICIIQYSKQYSQMRLNEG